MLDMVARHSAAICVAVMAVALADQDGFAAPHYFARSVAAFDAASARAEQRAVPSDSRLITSSAMGPVRLKMTLASVREMFPTSVIERVSDGDGAALVEVAFAEGDSLVLWADEDDPDAPIDWSRHIVTIYTFSETFHTIEGVRPGSLVDDVVRIFGPIEEVVVSEIESRQFIMFERQPSWLTLRLDYTGIFTDHSRRTRQVQPGATILAISVSLHDQ